MWIYGGYYISDFAVGPGKRWLFFLGLGIILLYLPLYAYRRYMEDRRAKDPRARGKRSVGMGPLQEWTWDAADVNARH